MQLNSENTSSPISKCNNLHSDQTATSGAENANAEEQKVQFLNCHLKLRPKRIVSLRLLCQNAQLYSIKKHI